MWTCKKCEQSNPNNFEICWNCQAERDDLHFIKSNSVSFKNKSNKPTNKKDLDNRKKVRMSCINCGTNISKKIYRKYSGLCVPCSMGKNKKKKRVSLSSFSFRGSDLQSITCIIFEIAYYILISYLILNGNTILARLLCFGFIPMIILLSIDCNEDIVKIVAVIESISFVIIGIFLATYLFFTNLILAALWSLVFIFVPYFFIESSNENTVVVKTRWHGETEWHESKADFWERFFYNCSLGFSFYMIIISLLFLIFYIGTCFSQHKLYLLFWQCWPFN